MHGKMISNDRSEHLPRPPWRNSLQRRWQAPRACRSRPQRRRSRPGQNRWRPLSRPHELRSWSPVRYCVRYIAAIIAQSCQTEHKVDVRFHDRDYARWTGQPNTDVIAQGGTVDAAPDVEPTSSIPSRARPALHAWAEQAQACDHTLIVVTHDAVISPVCQCLRGVTATRFHPHQDRRWSS